MFRQCMPPPPASPFPFFVSSNMLRHHKAILRLGLPIAVGQLGVIIMGFADTMMVGRYSTGALAASSFVNSVFNLVAFLLMGYSYGLTPLVGSLFGRGCKPQAGTTLGSAVVCNLLFALLLMAVMGWGYTQLHHMGQPAEIMPLVRPYYLAVLASVPFLALFNALRQFTDGITETRTAMWALLTGNGLNILGNWLLIYGIGPFPELGLLGAGLSTLCSRVVMAVVLLAVLLDWAVASNAGVQFSAVTGATCLWFIASEGASVLENAAELGVPIPAILRRALEILRKSGGEDDGGEQDGDE